jgi:transposase
MWQPRGESIPYGRYFNVGGVSHNYTLLAAADINGFVSEACQLVRRRTGADDLDPEAGTIDTERFLQWVETQLVPVLGEYAAGEPRSIVVLDNASIHSDDRIRVAIEATGALLMYQSAYSPDLNPIEMAFHQYKAHLKRHHTEYVGDVHAAHVSALGAVSGDNMRRYFHRVGGIRNVAPEAAVHGGGDDDEELEQMLMLMLGAVLMQQGDNYDVDEVI